METLKNGHNIQSVHQLRKQSPDYALAVPFTPNASTIARRNERVKLFKFTRDNGN